MSIDAPRIIERAFEIARSGQCPSIDDLKRQLRSEQFTSVDQHLGGSQIRKQLRELIAKSRGGPVR